MQGFFVGLELILWELILWCVNQHLCVGILGVC